MKDVGAVVQMSFTFRCRVDAANSVFFLRKFEISQVRSLFCKTKIFSYSYQTGKYIIGTNFGSMAHS